MKTEKEIFCYLGATVVDSRVIERLQKYSDFTRAWLGIDTIVISEPHITILPPFLATYENATRLNLSCACSTLIKNHPLTSSTLSIQELELMEWGNEIIIHFPVSIHLDADAPNNFLLYVNELRRKVERCGDFCWVGEMPKSFTPHLTVLKVKKDNHFSRIEELIRRSREEEAILFGVGYPTMYAKNKVGD